MAYECAAKLAILFRFFNRGLRQSNAVRHNGNVLDSENCQGCNSGRAFSLESYTGVAARVGMKAGWMQWGGVQVLALMLALSQAGAAPQTGGSSGAAHKKHAAAHATSRKVTAAKSTHHAAGAKSQAASAKRGGRRHAGPLHKKSRRKPLSAKAVARSHKLQAAFVASSQLRPMAQELAQMRSPAAYAGVSSYARSHTGEASAAAYLALGHAYLLDKRYSDAVNAFHSANVQGKSLDDYADYLTAQSDLQSGQLPQAELVLNDFAKRHPDSIFVNSIPVLQANLFLQQGDPQAALLALNAHKAEPIANNADFQLSMAKALLAAGKRDEAARGFRRVFLGFPLSYEATQAKTQLAVVGSAVPLTVAERKAHADALYAAGRFSDAGDEYRSLAGETGGVNEGLRRELLAAAAGCDWKLKRLDKSTLDRIPDSNDEAGARRDYLLMELARNKDDGETQRQLVAQMETRFPASVWLAEALYSSGNMYLLRKDYPHAIEYYGELARRFPRHTYAPSAHWRAAWLNYRLEQYSDAAKMFDEQIAIYPGGKEIPAALYWRGRVYEEQERRPDMASAYYRTVVRVYRHYYYAAIGQERLNKLGATAAAHVATLENMAAEPIPELSDDVPEDDPHVVKARLLANAGLNEYIPAEIQAGDGSNEWGAFAEADIYESYGEIFRAMRVLKRAIPYYTSAPLESIPLAYWRILFPTAYWAQIKAEAAANGLDPYMVAALIRQETEFNAQAVSNKSAYGLMQLLPSVGKSMAKEEGLHHFDTNQLLDPSTNIRLGTRYLKQTLNRFGGQPEYAFAAYNAGDDRVLDWQSIGKYRGMDEFVESIPFTETREYVQAIVRNEQIYKDLEKLESSTAGRSAHASQ